MRVDPPFLVGRAGALFELRTNRAEARRELIGLVVEAVDGVQRGAEVVLGGVAAFG